MSRDLSHFIKLTLSLKLWHIPTVLAVVLVCLLCHPCMLLTRILPLLSDERLGGRTDPLTNCGLSNRT